MEDITNRLAETFLSPPKKATGSLQGSRSAGMKPKKIWKLEDFDIGPKKGEGRFGKVHIARVKGLNLVFALKVMTLKDVSPTLLERELEIHRKLRHPHIVRLHTWFTDSVHAYIVMDWCNKGTVYDMLYKNSNGFSTHLAARYTAQLTEAVKYLHGLSPPIVHRDIKPENTFLDEKGNLKLGDFGFSAFLQKNPRKTICGTPDYFAPEICKREAYGKSIDVWAIGVFCFEMCYGLPPFVSPEGAPESDLNDRIQNAEVQFPHDAHDDERDLITAILEKHPRDRLSLSGIQRHPFLVNNYYECK